MQIESLIPIALLILTSSVVVGLVSLWAAVSQQHWFLRTAAVGLLLVPCLLIPAYELVICSAATALFVVFGIVVRRRFLRWYDKRRKYSVDPPSSNAPQGDGPKFSLQTLFLLTVVAVVVVAIGARLPHWDGHSWAIILAVAWQGAVQALCAAWIFGGQARSWWRIPIGLAVAAVSWASVSFGLDLLAPKMILFGISVAPHPFGDHFANFFAIPVTGLPFDVALAPYDEWLVRFLVAIGSTVAMAAWIMCLSVTGPPVFLESLGFATGRRQSTIKRCIAGLLLLGLTFFFVSIPVEVWLAIRSPTPIPERSMPSPNGYEVILEFGAKLENSVLTDPDSASDVELTAALAEHEAVLQKIHAALAGECKRPILFDYGNLEMAEVQILRDIARAFATAGRFAELEGHHDAALVHYQDILRLGAAIENEALLLDRLIGIAIRGMGMEQIAKTSPELSETECRDIVELIRHLRAKREPIATCQERDRVWVEHTRGWQGRLDMWIERTLTKSEDNRHAEYHADARDKLAQNLLLAELAVRAFKAREGRLPVSLAEATLGLSIGVPTDVWNERPLSYRLNTESHEGFVVYSFGSDGDDDGGQSIPFDEFNPLGEIEGDVTLHSLYGDAENVRGEQSDRVGDEEAVENAEPCLKR